MLNIPELQGEARTNFLKFALGVIVLLLEIVPVMPEKYEVALVVKGDRSPTKKVRLLWEERGQHSAHPSSKSRVEVVQNKFRIVAVVTSGATPDLLAELQTRQSPIGGWSVRQVAHVHSLSDLSFFVKNENVCEILLDATLYDSLYCQLLPGVIECVWNHRHQLLQKVKGLGWSENFRTERKHNNLWNAFDQHVAEPCACGLQLWDDD